MEEVFLEKLSDILDRFENTRQSFRNLTKKGEISKDSLNEFQSRFVDLKAEIRPYRAYLTKEWTRRDDKAATAIKFRIAVAMTRGEYETGDGETKLPTITNAEKLASGSKEYREFVEQRGFYRESLTNISDCREDLNSYINEIKDRLK